MNAAAIALAAWCVILLYGGTLAASFLCMFSRGAGMRARLFAAVVAAALICLGAFAFGSLK